MVNFRRQLAFNTVGNIVTLFCQWIIIMALPRLSSFQDAGLFSIGVSICSILNIFATLSLNSYQVADQCEKYSESDYAVCRLFTIGASTALGAVLVILLNYSVEQILIVFGYHLYRSLLHFAFLHTAMLQVKERLDLVGLIMIIEGAVSALCFLATFVLYHNLVISTFAMALLGGGVYLGLASIFYRKTLGHRYPIDLSTRNNISALLKIGGPILIATAVPIVITSLPRLILDKTDGSEIVGIFSTLAAPTIVIPTILMGLFAPFIIQFSNMAKKGDLKSIQKRFMKITAVTLLFGLVCIGASILMANAAFQLLYGEEILPYTGLFNWLVLGIILYSIGNNGISLLIAKQQGTQAAVATIITLLVSIPIMFYSIETAGIEGATFGLILSYLLFAVTISVYALFYPLDTDLSVHR